MLSCLQNICSIGNLLKALNATKYKYLLPDPEQALTNTRQTRHSSLEQIWPLQIFPLVKYEDLGFTFQHILHVLKTILKACNIRQLFGLYLRHWSQDNPTPRIRDSSSAAPPPGPP